MNRSFRRILNGGCCLNWTRASRYNTYCSAIHSPQNKTSVNYPFLVTSFFAPLCLRWILVELILALGFLVLQNLVIIRVIKAEGRLFKRILVTGNAKLIHWIDTSSWKLVVAWFGLTLLRGEDGHKICQLHTRKRWVCILEPRPLIHYGSSAWGRNST